MKSLVKETVKLHKIMDRCMHSETIKKVFSHIFELYVTKFEQELDSINIYSPKAKMRLLDDMQFLIRTLSELEHIEGISGGRLEVAVNNIRVKESPPPVPKKTVTAPVKPVVAPPVVQTSPSFADLKKFSFSFGRK